MAKGKGKKKAKGTSNVFSMFEQSQIQEFKEAFGMIDANRDGFIDKEDLRSTYASLGVLSVDSDKVTIVRMNRAIPGMEKDGNSQSHSHYSRDFREWEFELGHNSDRPQEFENENDNGLSLRFTHVFPV